MKLWVSHHGNRLCEHNLKRNLEFLPVSSHMKTADMDSPFIPNPIDIEAQIIRNALHCERIFQSNLEVLSFPEEYVFERYRFSSNSIIYLESILRPHITNRTHRGCALTSQQILCIALRFFANGSFLYNIGDSEHFAKATVCRAVRRVTLALKCLLPVMVVFPGHKPVGNIKEEFHRIAGDWCRNILFFFFFSIIIYILLWPQSGVSSLISCHFAGLPNVIGCIDGT